MVKEAINRQRPTHDHVTGVEKPGIMAEPNSPGERKNLSLMWREGPLCSAMQIKTKENFKRQHVSYNF